MVSQEVELLTNLLEKTNLGVLLEEWAKLPYDQRCKVQDLLALFQQATEDLHIAYMTWGIDQEWWDRFKENRKRKRGTEEEEDAALAEAGGTMLSA